MDLSSPSWQHVKKLLFAEEKKKKANPQAQNLIVKMAEI